MTWGACSSRVRTLLSCRRSLVVSRLSRNNLVVCLVAFPVVRWVVPVVLVVPSWVLLSVWWVVLSVLVVPVWTVVSALWVEGCPLVVLCVLVVVSPNRSCFLLSPRLVARAAAFSSRATVLSMVRTSLFSRLTALSALVSVEVVTVAVIMLIVHMVHRKYTRTIFIKGGTRVIRLVIIGRMTCTIISAFMFYSR